MPNSSFFPISGVVQSVNQQNSQCCQQIVTIITDSGSVNFILSPDTYVVNGVRLRRGMQITAFYDSNLPVPLIYPPQYQAVIIGQRNYNENIAVGYFNNNILLSEQPLRLNIADTTDIVTANGQSFACELDNRLLIVYYGATTRSIPPQTTPRKIIVMC